MALLMRLSSNNAASMNAPDICEQFQMRTQSCHDDSVATTTHKAISEDVPLSYQMNSGSSHVWSTPHCCPMQVTAVETAIFDLECEGKLLVVDRSGGGKANILR